MLRAIEHKIESLFEGVFGRCSGRTSSPSSWRRKLAKEMDDHRSVSVSKVYVPNEYSIYLCSADRAQFADYDRPSPRSCAYLAEHARREGLALMTSPRVSFHTDDDLHVGEFGIATRMAHPTRRADVEGPAETPSRGTR